MKTLAFTFFLALIGSFGFAQTRKLIDSLKIEIAKAKDDTNKVRLMNQIANRYSLNSADTALIYRKQSLALAEKLEDATWIARTQTVICWSLTTMGNYPIALEYGLKGRLGFEKLKDTAGLSGNHLNIAMCFREQGDYSNALKYALSGLKLAEQFWSRPDRIHTPVAKFRISNAQGILCSIYEKNNQLDSTIKYAEKGLTWRKDWSGVLYTLGIAYLKKGDYSKALYYLKSGLNSAIRTDFQKDKLEILTGITNLFIQKGELDSAAFYAKKVLTDKYGKTFPASVLVASSQMASIYEAQNQTDSAFKYLKKTIILKDSLFNQGKTIAIQNVIFKDEQRKRELEEAEIKFQNRLKIYGLIGGLTVLLLVALLLWRNNLHKQHANNLLQEQKDKVENTLLQLKSTQTQLIQKEKLASLGELTAGIAHEIQNPLNFVNNFSEISLDLAKELIEERAKAPEQRDEELMDDLVDDITQNQEKINLHGKRASNIVKGMLEHSRASSGKKELTDINALAEEYIRLAYNGLKAKDNSINLNIETDFDKSLQNIEVIPQDIGRVLLNLLNNAFYAISVGRAGSSPDSLSAKVTVSTKNLENTVEIGVTDNGIGMSEATKAKIFQPFFTTKPTGEGTGLGLSLAYDIITKGHGGTIEVESTEGLGSEFIITLPTKTNA